MTDDCRADTSTQGRGAVGGTESVNAEGATLACSLVGDSDSFDIDTTSGELFYRGSGEDYEFGTTRFTLTVRASDGNETADTTVNVNVTDVEETVDPPAEDGDQTAPQTVSEPEDEDFSDDTSTSGRVAVGETATGDIETAGDRDWLAVEQVAGRTYTIDLRGRPLNDGRLSDPYLYGIHDADGNLIEDTTNDDGGEDYNSRVTFTAPASGTHYIAAGAYRSNQGTYEVEVSEEPPMIRVVDAEATEGDDSAIVFRVTLESTSSGTVTVNYATADGTATAGEDYTATSGTLTFAPGETEKTVSVAIIDDEVEDSGETFRLILSDPAGGSLADAEATGTIFNTDPPPTQMSVSEAAGEDLPADTTTTGVVAIGATAAGEIESGSDRDWFAVTLTAGTRYRIDLKGSDTGDGTLADPRIYGIHYTDANRTARNSGRIFVLADSLGFQGGSSFRWTSCLSCGTSP